MTKSVTYIKSTGCIVTLTSGTLGVQSVINTVEEFDTIQVTEPVDIRRDYIVDGAVVRRPELDVSVLHGHSSTTLPPLDLPPGTEVHVDGKLVGISDGSQVEIVLPYAGSWSVELRPPFPMMKSVVTLEVA